MNAIFYQNRTDGFTSLAVLLGAGGVAIGWRWADPVVGLVITAAIAFVLKDAAREVYRRLMDAVDPALVDTAEQSLADIRSPPGMPGEQDRADAAEHECLQVGRGAANLGACTIAARMSSRYTAGFRGAGTSPQGIAARHLPLADSAPVRTAPRPRSRPTIHCGGADRHEVGKLCRGATGQTRVNSMTQLDSHVCPPSAENSCSQRAEVGVMSDQMKCALIGLPSWVSSP